MRIVVTGAAGFVGANVVHDRVARGDEVVAVVRPGSDPWRLVDAACVVRDCELSNRRDLETLLHEAEPEAIISAAAHGAYSDQQDLDRMLDVNVRAVAAVVDFAVERGLPLLHFGSSSEYGHQTQPPAETARVSPNSTYAVTKAAGSHFVCDAVERRGLLAVVLRLYSVYGPWEEPTRLLPTVARWALAGRLPPTLVSPEIARDFVSVDDVLLAVDRWVSSPVRVSDPAIVNIGTGRQSTIADVIDVARRTCAIDEEPTWGSMPDRAWDTTSWVSDPQRAADVLRWSAQTDLATGFELLLRFVAQHPAHYPVPAS